MTLKRALEVSPELKRMYDTDPQVTELIDTALKVEGMPRHASTHAAGVVITPEPTDYYLPLGQTGSPRWKSAASLSRPTSSPVCCSSIRF